MPDDPAGRTSGGSRIWVCESDGLAKDLDCLRLFKSRVVPEFAEFI